MIKKILVAAVLLLIPAAALAQPGPGPVPSPWLVSGSTIYYNKGNVGIGTSTPGQKLEVNGSINVDGASGGKATIIAAPTGTVSFDLPATNGTAGQYLTSDGGAGPMTWTAPSGAPVASVAAMVALASPANYGNVNVASYWGSSGPAAGGGSFFWSSASTAAQDGCYVFKDSTVSGAGRWIRQKSPLQDGVDPYNCGFVGGGTSHPLSSYFVSVGAANTWYGGGFVTSTSQEMDGVAIQAAEASISPWGQGFPASNLTPVYGGKVSCPGTSWRYNAPIFWDPNTKFVGPTEKLVTTSFNGVLPTGPGPCLGEWTGPATGVPSMVATNFISTTSSSFSGTIVSSTATTAVFTDAAAKNYVGGIMTIAGQTRLILNQSYGGGNYTVGFSDPWVTSNPAGGSAIAIVGQAAGTRALTAQWMDGQFTCSNSGSYSFAYSVVFENINLYAPSGGAVANMFNCAPNSARRNSSSIGFDVGALWSGSYYFEDWNNEDTARQNGVIVSSESWFDIKNDLAWPQNSSATDIYRPTSTTRNSVIGYDATSATIEQYPYLNAGLLINGGWGNVTGGDQGEGADRGITITNASNSLGGISLNAIYNERAGYYPCASPGVCGTTPKTAAAGLWVQNTQLVTVNAAFNGQQFVPAFDGCAPNLLINGYVQVTAPTAPILGFRDGAKCSGFNGMDFGGSVVVNSVAPGSTENLVSPNAILSHGSPVVYQWKNGGQSVFNDMQVSTSLTVQNCNTPVATDSSGGAITINLMNVTNGSPIKNQGCLIYDKTASAATHNVTITSNTGNFNLTGSATESLTTAGGFINLRQLGPGATDGWAVLGAR